MTDTSSAAPHRTIATPGGATPARRPCRAAARAAAGWLLALATCAAHAAAPLPRLGADLSRASVSGLSSGGYMAVQMHVIHSATFARGAGVVAGGPYDCAEGVLFNALRRCMKHDAAIPVDRLAALTEGRARTGDIDPTRHLAASRVYLYAGTRDRTVSPAILDELHDYYRRFVPADRIAVRADVASAHAMITDDAGTGCAAGGPPFIADCDLDLAGEILRHLHGPLAPRNDGAPRGRLIEFDQTAFVRGHGMAATGWVYVPEACAAAAGAAAAASAPPATRAGRGGDAGKDEAAGGGAAAPARCGVHVAFHGCRQNAASVGQAFVRQAGYNRWADANALVVLYPQTGASAPNGCWDWWGYDSPRYATKAGPQVAAVKAMVDALASTASTAPVTPAASPAPASSAPPATASRAPPPAASFAPTCRTASNYDHVAAGRARVSLGMALARGSDQNLGWWNVFVTTTLKETAPGHWVVGSCP